MLIGYARVSTGGQSLTLQIDALEEAGCERVFQDQVSGIVNTRPNLNHALNFARHGDTLVVWRLDRLSRSLRDLIETVTVLEYRGVQLKSLHESIDTASSSGKLIFHLFGALAEFERNLIKERTLAGLQAARTRGRKGGRPPLLDVEKRKLAVKLYNDKNYSVNQICEVMGISKPTLPLNLRKLYYQSKSEKSVVPGTRLAINNPKIPTFGKCLDSMFFTAMK